MYKKVLVFIKKIYQDYFEIGIAFSGFLIILLAVAMDKYLFLQACPLCILTRYVFGLVILAAFFSILTNNKYVKFILISSTSLIGLLVTSRQIYIQNMSIEDIAKLSGCSMPFNIQVEYFGIVEAVTKTLAGGPSCAEDGWRFIFNFAEWGLVFFLIYFFASVHRFIKIP